VPAISLLEPGSQSGRGRGGDCCGLMDLSLFQVQQGGPGCLVWQG
jgi:hypothetical protein